VFDLAPERPFFLTTTPFAGVFGGLQPRTRSAAPKSKASTADDLVFTLVGGLVALSFIKRCAGFAVHGLPDANSFNSYFFSPYNALRIVKGAVWAAFIGLFRSSFVPLGDGRRPFALGHGRNCLLHGCFGKRLAFSGTLELADGYRVTALSASHTGALTQITWRRHTIPDGACLEAQRRSIRGWRLAHGGGHLCPDGDLFAAVMCRLDGRGHRAAGHAL
jgi:hypothetical protein